MTSSSVKNGRQKLMKPSTSPILMLSVTMAIISLGAITCANCGFVSTLLSSGDISTTFFHGSRKSCVSMTSIFCMIESSISENSRFFSSGIPIPPSILSSIAYARFVARSMMIVPLSGEKLMIPSILGLDSALVNSLKVTVSELATVTCTFFRRYTGRFVDTRRP